MNIVSDESELGTRTPDDVEFQVMEGWKMDVLPEDRFYDLIDLRIRIYQKAVTRNIFSGSSFR